MKLKAKTLVVSALVFGSTACLRLEPLITNEPAKLNEMTEPERNTLKVVAAKSTDRPTLRLQHLAATTPSAQGGHERHQKPETQQTAIGEGKVIAIDAKDGQVVIEHGEIRGFMGAMTMGYRVDSRSLLVNLKPVDKIRFVIDIPRKSIVKIERSKSH